VPLGCITLKNSGRGDHQGLQATVAAGVVVAVVMLPWSASPPTPAELDDAVAQAGGQGIHRASAACRDGRDQ
jgi:hypothetical protein